MKSIERRLDGAEARLSASNATDYDSMTDRELIDLAVKRGIELPESVKGALEAAKARDGSQGRTGEGGSPGTGRD